MEPYFGGGYQGGGYQKFIPSLIRMSPTFGGQVGQATNSTTYSQSINYGVTADADTYLIACFLYDSQDGNTGLPMSSVTLGGVSGTLALSFETVNTFVGMAFYYANVTSGTSGTFAATFAHTARNSGCTVWAIQNAARGISVDDSDSGVATSGTTITASITSRPGNAILYSSGFRWPGSGEGTNTFSSSVYGSITEDQETNVTANQTSFAAGHENRSASVTETITATSTLTIDDAVLGVISLRTG